MSFQEIKPIQKADSYLDIAFSRANRKVSEKKVAPLKTKLDKFKYLESIKISIIKDILISDVNQIIKDFPDINELPVFYKELVNVTIGEYELKHALLNLKWIVDKIKDFARRYTSRINKSKSIDELHKNKREFYGRISSLFKRADDNLTLLENARKTFKQFPVIKTKFPTIAIAGFPNVGKSTLIGKLSSSKPAVAAYPFTTKGIMIGYFKDKENIIQLLDTPGTLNRIDKMNMIEKQAWLALRHVAEKIIYIFDLTEPYPLSEQEELYRSLHKLKKPIIIYLSKTDILDKEKINKFIKQYKESITNIEDLKEIIKR